MVKPLNSISKKLFLSFGILVLNIVIISILALYLLFQTRKAANAGQELDDQRIRIIQLIKTDLDFLRFETVNTTYFETGKSSLLAKRDSLFKIIYKENDALVQRLSSLGFLDEDKFNALELALQKYSNTFKIVTNKINERGYKDFGLEGIMRACAHELESQSSPIALVDLLMLRRHEKDFMLRKEEKYIVLFDALANRLVGELHKRRQHNASGLLSEYQQHFHEVERLSFEIGISPTSGLMQSLNEQTEDIANNLALQTRVISAKKEALITSSAVIFSIVTATLVLMSMALTYYTSTRLARPLRKLSQSMGKFIVREGLDERDLEQAGNEDEIITLSQSFIKMSRKLKEQFNEILQQNNELKKLNAELDRFIYSAAHDLKSPLASLDGLVMLAEKEINDKQHSHYFGMMSASVKKLNGFIGDITDYAKNKRQQLKVERIDLAIVLSDMISLLKFLPEANRIRVDVKVHGDELFTDRTRIEIILKNLLSNAFRYSDFSKSQPVVTIEAFANEENLTLSITDNGIGIGKTHLDKIFNMFYRAVEHSNGTGIGLFLVKESVKMLRGKISVKSRVGEWTVFTLVIPNLKYGSINSPETEAIEFAAAD